MFYCWVISYSENHFYFPSGSFSFVNLVLDIVIKHASRRCRQFKTKTMNLIKIVICLLFLSTSLLAQEIKIPND